MKAFKAVSHKRVQIGSQLPSAVSTRSTQSCILLQGVIETMKSWVYFDKKIAYNTSISCHPSKGVNGWLLRHDTQLPTLVSPYHKDEGGDGGGCGRWPSKLAIEEHSTGKRGKRCSAGVVSSDHAINRAYIKIIQYHFSPLFLPSTSSGPLMAPNIDLLLS